jgi:hypothetical protein
MKAVYPNLANEYTNRADYLAGNIDDFDSVLNNKFGPEAMRAFNKLSGVMKGNIIEGNINVPYAQTFSIPLTAMGLDVRSSLASAVKLVTNKSFRDMLIAGSPTLQLRLEGAAAQNVHRGLLRRAINKPSNWIDTHTMLYALGGKYVEVLRATKDPVKAMQEAEQFASVIQATLSKVTTAPVLRSQAVQSAIPYQNQILSGTKAMTSYLFREKSGLQKLGTAAKGLATALPIAAAGALLYGEKSSKSPLGLEQGVPMLGVATQGIGGPAAKSIGNIAKAKSTDDFLVQLVRAGVLVQPWIPGGLQVGRFAEWMVK